MASPHGNGGNIVFFQIRDGCEVVVGKGAEGSNFLFFDTDENRFRADINTGAVEIDFLQRRHYYTP
jgi:hypothetical protein